MYAKLFSCSQSLPTHARFIKILDSVLHHLVPAWDHTLGTFSEIKVSRPTQCWSRQCVPPSCSCSCSCLSRVPETCSRARPLLGLGTQEESQNRWSKFSVWEAAAQMSVWNTQELLTAQAGQVA